MCARCAWGAPEGGGTDPGPADRCQVHCVDELRNSRFENNKTLLRELHEDLRADAGGLWEATRKDAIQDGGPAAEGVRRQGLLRCLGAWARACVHVYCLQADRLLLNPRFDVEQIKPNWANRLRPIDKLSWSPVQPEAGQAWPACTQPLIATLMSRAKGGDGRHTCFRRRGGINGRAPVHEQMHPDMLDNWLWAQGSSSVKWGERLASSRPARRGHYVGVG